MQIFKEIFSLQLDFLGYNLFSSASSLDACEGAFVAKLREQTLGKGLGGGGTLRVTMVMIPHPRETHKHSAGLGADVSL